MARAAPGASGGLERADPTDCGSGDHGCGPRAGKDRHGDADGIEADGPAKTDGDECHARGAKDGAGRSDHGILEAQAPDQAVEVVLDGLARCTAREGSSMSGRRVDRGGGVARAGNALQAPGQGRQARHG